MAFVSHTVEYGSPFLSLSDEFRPEDGQLLGRLFSQREAVTSYIHFPPGIIYSVFINAAKVDVGCPRVVKLLGEWWHVKKRFSLFKQPKY